MVWSQPAKLVGIALVRSNRTLGAKFPFTLPIATYLLQYPFAIPLCNTIINIDANMIINVHACVIMNARMIVIMSVR